jgi:hypothetical protein
MSKVNNMSNNKQSSIEWLAQQLYEQMEMCGDGGVYDKIIKQAKVLHEQEIIDAYYGELYYESASNGEHYYKETFGDKNNGEITTMGGDNIPDTNTSTTGNILNTWRSHGVNITGNTSGNIWGGDRTSTTENISGTWGGHTMVTTIGNTSAIWGGDTSNNKIYDSNTWMFRRKMVDENVNRIKAAKQIWDKETMAEYINKIEAEKQIWDKTVNWDKNNIEVKTEVNDEEQALYNKTIVVKDGAMETIRVSKPDETNDGTLAVIEITVKVRSN